MPNLRRKLIFRLFARAASAKVARWHFGLWHLKVMELPAREL